MEFLQKVAPALLAVTLSGAILFDFLKTQFIFMLPVLTAFSLDGRGLEDK